MPPTNIEKIKDAVRSIVHAEIDDLKNGFKQDIIREVKTTINGEIKIQLAEVWDKMTEVVEAKILVAKNDVASTMDRFVKKAENKLDYFEVLVKGQNELGGRIKHLEDQRQTCLTNITRLQAQTNGRGEKIVDLEKRVNDVEDQPGQKALTAEERRKSTIVKVVVGILIALGASLVTLFVTWVRSRIGGI
jgi:hypothetical protein